MELSVAWLLALVPAMALVHEHARGRRRRQALNRALHELRRPLQSLALLDGRPALRWRPELGANARRGLLEQAGLALADLERTVNGGLEDTTRNRVSCREVVLAALERSRPALDEAGVELRVFWDAGPAPVQADQARIAQALDNLIANAIEHGGSSLVLTGARVSGRIRIVLTDAGARRRPPAAVPARRDPRRGHGLGLVSEVAISHGGRFALRRSDAGAVAALELPLAEPRPAAA